MYCSSIIYMHMCVYMFMVGDFSLRHTVSSTRLCGSLAGFQCPCGGVPSEYGHSILFTCSEWVHITTLVCSSCIEHHFLSEAAMQMHMLCVIVVRYH